MADRIQNLSIAFGSFANGSYTAVANSNFGGQMVQIHSRLNADAWMRINVRGVPEEIFLPSFQSKWVPLPLNGSIEVRHDGVVPSSGKVVLESYATNV